MTPPTAILAALLGCPPQASVEGDRVLVAEVRELLAARGVGEAHGRCPAVRARVERSGELVALSLDDGRGHRATRSVRTTPAIAAVIAGWAHVEVAPAPPAPARLDPPPPSAAVPRSPADPWKVAAFARVEGSAANDGGIFGGALVGVERDLGSWRPQLLLRLMLAQGAPGQFDRVTAGRSGVEGLGAVATTLGVAGLALHPYAAVGLGRMLTTRTDGYSRYSVAPRIEGGASVALPLGAVDLQLASSLSYTPLARNFAAVAPADSGLPQVERWGRSLPGEPSWMLHFGVGVGYGPR